MKKKITIKELKSIIKEEASKLQRRTLLENEKKGLQEELGMMMEVGDTITNLFNELKSDLSLNSGEMFDINFSLGEVKVHAFTDEMEKEIKGDFTKHGGGEGDFRIFKQKDDSVGIQYKYYDEFDSKPPKPLGIYDIPVDSVARSLYKIVMG